MDDYGTRQPPRVQARLKTSCPIRIPIHSQRRKLQRRKRVESGRMLVWDTNRKAGAQRCWVSVKDLISGAGEFVAARSRNGDSLRLVANDDEGLLQVLRVNLFS